MKLKLFFLMAIGLLTSGIQATVPATLSPCSQPFFSEYIEGSSNNKALELYNPTNAPLDLGPYKIYLSGNGGSYMNDLNLSGTIAPGDVYTMVNSQADPALLGVADVVLSYPSVVHFNGDDAIFLMDTTTNDTLDIIGVVGVDPGANWPVGSGATSENTLVRNASVDQGQTDWTVGAFEWTVHPQNTFGMLGSHTATCAAPPVNPCSLPFFSEYLEGSSNNKGLEVYNPSSSTLDLGPYKIYLSVNGGTAINEFNLSGTLAPGGVYAITTDQADPVLQAVADTAFAYPSIAHFNGNDALMLVDTTTLDTVDVIGAPGMDPGTNWVVGSGATSENTLVRSQSIDRGQTDWTIGATEWDVHPQNTYSFFGSHTSSCVGAPSTPTVDFQLASQTVSEGAGTVDMNLIINPTSSNSETIELLFTLGANLDPSDGTITPTPDLTTGLLTLTVPANEDTVSVSLNVLDDAVIEGNETLFVDIVDLSGGLDSGSVTSTQVIVQDNDAPAPVIPTYTIDEVTGVDANGEPDSLGVQVTLFGVVYTDDFDDNAGYSFYMYDQTGGINVFRSTDASNYQVSRGDSIMVQGEIDVFNGLTELAVDSIAVLDSNVTLKQPDVVTTLDETTEGEYIRLNGWEMVDPAQWTTGSGSGGFNVDITNGTDTVVMRIDAATDLYNSPVPVTGPFDVIGAGAQYDSNSPFDEGYQIFPRDSADIIPEDFSVEEIASVNVSVYPNPAQEALYVQTVDSKPKNIALYNSTGQRVRMIESTDPRVRLSLEGLSKGVYVITVEVEGRAASRTVVVE